MANRWNVVTKLRRSLQIPAEGTEISLDYTGPMMVKLDDMNEYYGLEGLQAKMRAKRQRDQDIITKFVVSGSSKDLRKWWDFSRPRHQVFRQWPHSEIDRVIYQYSISLFFYNFVPDEISRMGIEPFKTYFYPDESYVTPDPVFLDTERRLIVATTILPDKIDSSDTDIPKLLPPPSLSSCVPSSPMGPGHITQIKKTKKAKRSCFNKPKNLTTLSDLPPDIINRIISYLPQSPMDEVAEAEVWRCPHTGRSLSEIRQQEEDDTAIEAAEMSARQQREEAVYASNLTSENKEAKKKMWVQNIKKKIKKYEDQDTAAAVKFAATAAKRRKICGQKGGKKSKKRIKKKTKKNYKIKKTKKKTVKSRKRR